ncbi:hypothetical protein C8R31_104287 [Nitrosospira sp. Nsp2]|uniref:hypothetical protein n=1 Tax=Nitrosospira sp. Nsp2 TaxID=136548 RepID=UPI000D3134C4|nr:hypothetical protein [Nitrosospira sp. Nsp2]PTR15258.1 hypothetical protein C8R31_104287 [Nitrosospira sp. Nsp2]
MANYIDKEILSEAYSHFEIDIFNDKEALAKLEKDLTSYFLERAEYVFGKGVRVEIEFEEGSLRTKIKIVGSAALIIYGLMADFGGFTQTVGQLAKESTVLAQNANFELAFRTKAAYCEKISVEKRRGVFGKTNDLLAELDFIRNSISRYGIPTPAVLEDFHSLVNRLYSWHNKAANMITKLESEESKACISAGLLEELEKFPASVPWEDELKTESFRALILRSDPDLAGSVATEVLRMKEIVKFMRRHYKDIVEQYAPVPA